MAREESIAGFQVLPVQYGKVSGIGKPVHAMYIRAHTVTEDDERLPGGRTLFVVNLPTDTTRGMLRDLFRKAGAVHSVTIHDIKGAQLTSDDEDEDEEEDEEEAPTGRGKNQPPKLQPLPALEPNVLLASGSTAHVVFLDASSLERALQLPGRYASKPYAWPQPGKEAIEEEDAPKKKPRRANESRLVGLPYLLESYRMHRPDHGRVKEHVDSAIARYAWIREHPQWLLEQRLHGNKTTSAGVGIEGVSVGPDGELLDADGFTIVQKGAKYGRSGGGEGGGGSFAAITPDFEEMMRENPDKKKSKELSDFYRFQFREKKRQRTSTCSPRICHASRPVRGGQAKDCGAQVVDALQTVRIYTHPSY